MRRSLLCLALVALAPAAFAEVPARVNPSAADVGPTRESPEGLSHWQKMAEDMAAEAAPALKAKGVTVSAGAYGPSSTFDGAFQDFFVTALYRLGVPVTANGYGARVEIDSYPLNFQAPRTTARVTDLTCRPHGNHEHCSSSSSRYKSALRDELALNLRVFDGGNLVFSGSTTYYLPNADINKYRPAKRVVERQVYDARTGEAVGSTMNGEYGTRTWR